MIESREGQENLQGTGKGDEGDEGDETSEDAVKKRHERGLIRDTDNR